MTVSRCNKPFSKVPKNNPRLLHSKDWTGITQIQIKSIIWVSALRVTFMHVLIEELYAPLCITVLYQQQSFIYMWLFPHICHFTLSNRKSKRSAISTDPRRLFINLLLINCLDSPIPCCLCLYLIIKFKLYIKLNHLLNHH